MHTNEDISTIHTLEVMYSPLQPCFYGNRWVLFHLLTEVVDSVSYTTGSCKMVTTLFSVNCFVHLLLFTVKTTMYGH